MLVTVGGGAGNSSSLTLVVVDQRQYGSDNVAYMNFVDITAKKTEIASQV